MVKNLDDTESEAMMGLPAGRFNRRSSPPTTAWGIFQFNAPIWRHVSLIYLAEWQILPWLVSEKEEISIPLLVYTKAVKYVLDLGGSPLDMARSIRIWQKSQSIRRIWLGRVRRSSFGRAWRTVENIAPNARVGQNIRSTIGERLQPISHLLEGDMLTKDAIP